jgi:hypothetical protein
VPDRRHALLESDLRALASEVDAELGERDLSTMVTSRLAAQRSSAPSYMHARPRRRRLAVALVAGLVITATAAIPPARAAVTDFLDVGAVRLHRAPPPGPVATPTDLQLGEPTTLDAARARLPIVVPSARDVGSPDEVWLTSAGGGGVSLVYRARPGLPPAEHTRLGLLVQEFAGDHQGSVNKYLSTGARAQAVPVGPAEGIFISGGNHYLFYEAATGAEVYEAGRLVGNALIFQRGPLTIRLEADLPRDRMVAIAESLR